MDIPAINALALSPDGSHLVVAGTSIGVCDLKSEQGSLVGTYIGHSTPTTAISFSDDGVSSNHASISVVSQHLAALLWLARASAGLFCFHLL